MTAASTARPPFVCLLGTRVTFARRRADLSLDDAADRLGWETQILADAEAGRPVLPEQAAALAWLYHASLPDLIDQMTNDRPAAPTTVVDDVTQLTLDGELPGQLWLVEGGAA